MVVFKNTIERHGTSKKKPDPYKTEKVYYNSNDKKIRGKLYNKKKGKASFIKGLSSSANFLFQRGVL
jgi:hypothetical protein